MPWNVVKKNNGFVITDGASYFKASAKRVDAQKVVEKWKKASAERIPVPPFRLAEMDLQTLTGDIDLPSRRWGIVAKRVVGDFYQLSKPNKINAASVRINALPEYSRNTIIGILNYAVDMHMADTQFFITGNNTIKFIDIDFKELSNDPNLAALVLLCDPR